MLKGDEPITIGIKTIFTTLVVLMALMGPFVESVQGVTPRTGTFGFWRFDGEEGMITDIYDNPVVSFTKNTTFFFKDLDFNDTSNQTFAGILIDNMCSIAIDENITGEWSFNETVHFGNATINESYVYFPGIFECSASGCVFLGDAGNVVNFTQAKTTLNTSEFEVLGNLKIDGLNYDIETRVSGSTGAVGSFKITQNTGKYILLEAGGSDIGSATRMGVIIDEKIAVTTNTPLLVGTTSDDYMLLGTNNTEVIRITNDGDVLPGTDNTVSMGTVSKQFSDVRSVLINGADYIFANSMRMVESFPDEESDGLPRIYWINDLNQTIGSLDRDGNLRLRGTIEENFAFDDTEFGRFSATNEYRAWELYVRNGGDMTWGDYRNRNAPEQESESLSRGASIAE